MLAKVKQFLLKIKQVALLCWEQPDLGILGSAGIAMVVGVISMLTMKWMSVSLFFAYAYFVCIALIGVFMLRMIWAVLGRASKDKIWTETPVRQVS